ncbi:MAG: hypothetical protein M1833_005546 [Piccolia ochrophora]|nr:MAG: hypothetical protein M1833_005546 [Piccolia ochrophora]
MPLQLSSLNRNGQGPQIIFPSDPDYGIILQTYINGTNTPLAIVRPKNAAEVSRIVRYAVAYDISITVRGGGHELYGRSIVNGALAIDLRLLNSTQIIDKGTLARLGGGTSHREYATALASEGFITPFSTVVSVGLGWNMIGGYSLVSGHYGLGVDQIVGAKVVNWQGEIVEADEDMLFGIRGAQGNFGVVVELTIKIYPIETPRKTILAGQILFESSNISSITHNFFRGYEALESKDLPLEIGIEPFVVNILQLGRTFGVFVISTSADLNASKFYVDKVKEFGNLIDDTVAEISIPA